MRLLGGYNPEFYNGCSAIHGLLSVSIVEKGLGRVEARRGERKNEGKAAGGCA